MKKLLTLILATVVALGCCFGMTACGKDDDFKVGLICLHGESSTYDKNFIDAFEAACEAKGVSYIIKTDIAESTDCYDTAMDLVDQGCDLIFADSFGHEDHMIRAAKENPDVEFCHATGTKAHTENVANFHNAFASIYEGRYLAGVAAGLKLNTMKDKAVGNNFKVGYVGAWTYAEVISGFTSWFLGLRSALDTGYTATMEVQFTGSWYDEAAERDAANLLIDRGAVLISQHADSMGAPTACETALVPNVSYNGSTATACPNTFIISSRINWQPYYEYIIDCAKNGTEIATDWSQGLGTTWGNGSVALTDLGNAAAPGTQEYINNVIAEFKAGTRKVFDLSKFTVGGNPISSEHKADVDTDAAYTPDTVVIKTANGITYFAESEFRSAPYFDLNIDGITYLNTKY